VLSHVEDPALQKMIKKHEEDEVRHAQLFRARLAAQNATPLEVPSELRLIDRLDRRLGGFFDRPIDGGRGVMEAYTLLQVVEERALTQFTVMERAFREVDPETADVFVEVAKDEERHLKYCQAIAKRYAPSEAERQWLLAGFRLIEAETYRENMRNGLAWALDNVVPRGAKTALLRTIAQTAMRANTLPFTAFAQAA
jgi:rubrerythrin